MGTSQRKEGAGGKGRGTGKTGRQAGCFLNFKEEFNQVNRLLWAIKTIHHWETVRYQILKDTNKRRRPRCWE